MLALGACADDKGDTPTDTSVERPTLVDDDGDGYGADADCDDSDPSVSPGADELCNGLDDDCDGQTDEAGATDGGLWYSDNDGDTTGAHDSGVRSCAQPDGWVADDTDCDDSNAAVSPLVTEACDGIDNDCDGDIDEDGATGGLNSYSDADGDGYGDPASRVIVCSYGPEGVANDDDCDDTDASIKPGATELCDGQDNDCNGDADSDAEDMTAWYPDSDGDGYGVDGATAVACDKPTGYASTTTDCDDTDRRIYPGASERCDDEDNDYDGEIDESALDARTYYPDADADGYGTDEGTVTQCDTPDGDYATSGGDCDDDDATVSPGAEEIWYDGLDEDCDEASDYDQDGDGFVTTDLDDEDEPTYDPGTGDVVEDGSTTDGGDCDDENARVYPGNRERCDSADNDCDGEVDEDALDAKAWYTDGDGDAYGADDSEVDACDSPGDAYIRTGGDCDDAEPAINPGATEDTTDGIDNDCDGRTDESTGSTVVANGYFVAGFYDGDWSCLEYYEASAVELDDATICEGCDYGLEVTSTWVDGYAEDIGYASCGWDAFSIWGEIEEFTSDWSFASSPRYYDSPVAYYAYGDSWYPTSYYTDYTDYLQWTWFYDAGATGEVGVFWLY